MQVVVFVVGRLVGGVSVGQYLLYVVCWVFLWVVEQIVLYQVDFYFVKYCEFFGQFDVFGDDLGVRGLCYFQDGVDEFVFYGVQVDVVDEVVVDFYVVWMQF